ncbi:MAG: NAD(P)-dependent oxidoreductase [Planctomycetota bacterium]|nr:NAD(P)-dependent oxidoreductase [Planctomycetota bacterium]
MIALIIDKFEDVGIQGLKQLGCEVVQNTKLAGAAADAIAAEIARVKPAVLIVRSTKVPAGALAQAESLRLIVRAGSGVDNIDVPAATAKNIAVCNCPGMNAVAVAEITMGLLLACDRRIPDQVIAARAGQWNKKEFAKGKGLKGLTLGVIGCGAIGKEVIRRAKAFDMHVIGWSRSLTQASARDLGVEFGGNDRTHLPALAAKCDAITIHLPGGADTKQFIDKSFFAAMKPGAYFINTSRGSVVNEADLRDAITAKGLRAGLDVYDNQPTEPQAPWQSPTIALPGVFGTHHAGASTDQAQAAIAEETVRVVTAFKHTGKLENCVNAGLLKPR